MLWVYGALCMAVFTVRTIKRVIFHEARQYSEQQLCWDDALQDDSGACINWI